MEKLHNTFKYISTKAMSNNAFYGDVMSALSNLSLKSQSMHHWGWSLAHVTNSEQYCKVYGRRTMQTSQGV